MKIFARNSVLSTLLLLGLASLTACSDGGGSAAPPPPEVTPEEVPDPDLVVIEPGEDHHLISDETEPCINIWLHAGAQPHPQQREK